MIKIEIKIVGLISDENELNEIHNIAKIFVYESRMKDFNYQNNKKPKLSNNYIKTKDKSVNRRIISENKMQNILVKGLI